jgi:hypothetical protein
MPQKYQALVQAESAWNSSLAADEKPLRKRQVIWARWAARFWVMATMLFALLSGWLGLQLYVMQNRSSFAHGFVHELKAAKHLIMTEERVFQGSPRFLEDGTEYVPGPADGKPRPQYVGDPSEEIDNAWDRLHQGT